MKMYTVRKIYKYSEIVEVLADNYGQAQDLATQLEGERIQDDYLYDTEVINVMENKE